MEVALRKMGNRAGRKAKASRGRSTRNTNIDVPVLVIAKIMMNFKKWMRRTKPLNTATPRCIRDINMKRTSLLITVDQQLAYVDLLTDTINHQTARMLMEEIRCSKLMMNTIKLMNCNARTNKKF